MSEIDLNKVREEWPAVLAYLRSEYDVSEISIRTFLEPLEIAMVNNDKIIISVTESVNMPIITKKFSSLITVCVEEKLGHHFDVEFVSADNLNRASLRPRARQRGRISSRNPVLILNTPSHHSLSVKTAT